MTVGGVRAVWLNRAAKANGTLVYLHGGSYNAGPFKEQWEYLADLCGQTGMAGFLIDYRLAPQHQFPAAVDDAALVLETLLQKGELPAKWFLLGDSAGGGLAAALFYRLRESGSRLPAKMILMCGWFDLTISSPEIKAQAAIDPMLSPDRMVEAAVWYAGAADPQDPLVSPLFGDLRALPPTLIQCGTADLLVFENRRFYQKCLDAGADVRYQEYPDLFHDFMMISFLPESKRARLSQAEFLME